MHPHHKPIANNGKTREQRGATGDSQMTVVSPCTQDLMDSIHPHAVLSKLNDQRSQGLFCDVTIVVEDVKFRAHRNILAACSGYFRNALMASQSLSSSQVLEIVDLKSEVFASILNFIYSSKVASAGADDTRGIVAAGKRLGIPFLERLAEHDRQSATVSTIMRVRGVMNVEASQSPVPKNPKKEVSRPEDIMATTGPRITNAFSITEVGPGNNPFTPLVPTDGERQSPDVGQVSASCPAISCLTATNEPPHALSEHSYAVSQAEQQRDSSQKDSKKAAKPTQLQTKLAIQNIGPLKKRHRLRGTLDRNTTSTEDSQQQATDIPDVNCPGADSCISFIPSVVATPPPPLNTVSEPEKSTDNVQETSDHCQMEFEPPALSPHVEDSISIYGCEYCPEIFTNNALLTLHMEVHKRRFVSHLYCKFCDRKFMHLKRLRNHEHVCPKATRDPPEADSGDTLVTDSHSDNVSAMGQPVAEEPLDDPPSPCIPEPDQNNQSEARQGVTRVGKTGGSQRAYNCSVCKRVYVTLSSLKRHENVHSWQRAYPCHYCNKVFALAEYRTKHEIWHTGERRYQCIFCLETFMTYYILKNHQKSFHGIDPRLAAKKKSANGGFKASVYPIKLYRLLPMKFRKKRYKTYSERYGDSVEGTTLENNSLITPNEENSNPEPGSFNMPLTFMATTKTVAPVTPHMNFKQPLEKDISETCRRRDNSKDVEQRSSHFLNHNNTNILQTQTPALSCGDNADTIMNVDHFSRNIPFLTKTLKTVDKLGELSAAAKRVEAMTKELLLSGTDSLKPVKAVGSRKTETYLAKPVCPGPSVDGDALPLCQITVKIGNEAIIRRKIKGSKLFPRRRKKSRQRRHSEDPDTWFSTEDSSGSARLHNQMAISAMKELETYEDPNDHEASDKSWRPYYSYKAKKKKKKMRYKHRKDQQYFFPPPSGARTPAKEDYLERRSTGTDDSTTANSVDAKRMIKNSSPRATYKCDICDSSFITESGLRAHVIGSHPCFCRACGEQGPPGEVPAGGDYVCNNCMESGSCFDNTLQRSGTEKKYCCSFCPQRFLYVATKRSHERKHQEVGNGKAYKYDKGPPRSKHTTYLAEDSQQHDIKSEEDDEEITHPKEEGSGTSLGNIAPKMEGTADFPSIAPKSFQEMHSKTKDLLLASNSNGISPVLPTKVKHKMSKKRMDIQDSLYLPSKKHMHERDSGRGLLKRPKTNSHERHPHLLWKHASVKKGISMCKTEQWVCKQEPVFEG